jgi:hypothetical protein
MGDRSPSCCAECKLVPAGTISALFNKKKLSRTTTSVHYETLPFHVSQPPKRKNHGTQDSRVVPHRGTNWAALRLTTQIERDAVLSKSYGRG